MQEISEKRCRRSAVLVRVITYLRVDAHDGRSMLNRKSTGIEANSSFVRGVHACGKRRRGGARFGLQTVVAIAAAFAATSADAALETYQLQFRPSASPAVTGYELHFGARQGDYDTVYDIGEPLRFGDRLIYRASIDHEGDLYLAIRAYDSAGRTSPFTEEYRVQAPAAGPAPAPNPAPISPPGSPLPPPPLQSGETPPFLVPQPRRDLSVTLPRDAAVIGLAADRWGAVRTIFGSRRQVSLAYDSLAREGDVRTARCDLDGDGDEDVLLGLGSGSGGEILRLHLEAGRVVESGRIIAGTDRYQILQGETMPACGDLDGDGRAEIVVGFGTFAASHIQILDDSRTGFAPMGATGNPLGLVSLPSDHQGGRYHTALYPAVGDLDGDGRDEIVVGYGEGGHAAIAILDDAAAEFAPHPRYVHAGPMLRLHGLHALFGAQRAAHPALGDWDGDGLDEIVVGFGHGSAAWLALLDDANAPLYDPRTPLRLLQVGRSATRNTEGATWPQLADLDRDGIQELVVGFEGDGATELQVVEVPLDGFPWVVQDQSGFFSWGTRGTQVMIASPAAPPR